MSVNYQFNTTLSSAKPSLYAITPDHTVEVISKQHVMLSHTAKQQSAVLEHYLVNLIDVLKIFRTIPEHAAEIKAFMGLDDAAEKDIKNIINHLKELGFLVSGEEALTLARSGDNYRPLQTPPVVVVRTAGRVSMLKRFLQSAVENEQQYNARYEYLFIDDSTPEQAEANGINIAESGLNAEHIDKAKQQALLGKLVAEFPAHRKSIDFLLGEHELHTLSPTYGRTWNWGILLSAGKPVVFLDDDCVLQAYASPVKTSEILSFGSGTQDVTFLKKDTPLDKQLMRLSLDPIAQLATALGTTPKQFQCHADSFAGAPVAMVNKLSTAHVMISSQSIAGDPGSATPTWLYHLTGEAAQRFVGKSEADYKRRKFERFMWVGDSQPAMSFGGHYSVVARSFDNRQLLPPTLPVFRNEDALFTNLVHYLYPTAAVCSLPWTLAHMPEIERQWRDEDMQKAKSFEVTKGIDLLTDSEMAYGSADEKLQRLSLKLKAIFNADSQTAEQWLYQRQQAERASTACQLNNRLDEAVDMPDYWTADVEKIIQANLQGEQTLNCGEHTPEQLRAVLSCFGQSAAVWPALWAFFQDNRLV